MNETQYIDKKKGKLKKKPIKFILVQIRFLIRKKKCKEYNKRKRGRDGYRNYKQPDRKKKKNKRDYQGYEKKIYHNIVCLKKKRKRENT